MRTFRVLFGGGAAAVLAAGLLVATGQPASAVGTTTITRTAWASTDTRQPYRIAIDGAGDAPVGTWRDEQGRKHTSRAYFTFDITRFRGTVIGAAEFVAAQTAAEDCTQRPAIELWRTEDFTDRSSWRRPPAALDLLYTTTYPRPCPAPRVEWDATAGLRQAVAEGRSTLTLALQLPSDVERDPAQGVWFGSGARLTIDYNTVPNVPTDLMLHTDGPCAPQAPGPLHPASDIGVSARISDADGGPSTGEPYLEAWFALWPADRPAERVERRGTPGVSDVYGAAFPRDLLTHGQTYAWAARAHDGRDYSAWTEPCYVTVDLERPASPPGVSSTDYPNDGQWHGGPGTDGDFTFTANGVPDVAGYRYGWGYPTTFVAAEAPGGPVTVRTAPRRNGIDTLYVQSVDAAGNPSDTTTYQVMVASTGPRVSGQIGLVGQPSQFTFRPGMDGVVEYEYQLDGGTVQTVAAAPDGTAVVSIVLNTGGSHTLAVASRTASGVRATASYSFVVQTAPIVTSTDYPQNQTSGGLGVPGAFTFSPRLPNVVAYRYSFAGAPVVTVDAGADGTATVTWTPTGPGYVSLSVVSVGSDGTQSPSTSYSFSVRDLRPEVWSDLYTEWWPDGGPGIPATFTFSSELSGVTGFRYQLGGGAEETIDVTDGSGMASVIITPDRAGEHTLVVRALGPDGYVSPERTFVFLVAEPVSEA